MTHLRIPLALACLVASTPVFAAHTYELDIAPQPLNTALQQFAKQSGIQIVYYGKIAEGRSALGVSGKLTVEDALKRLLAGTDLQFEALDQDTIAISSTLEPSTEWKASAAKVSGQGIRLAQNGFSEHLSAMLSEEERSRDSHGAKDSADADAELGKLEEIVVTGVFRSTAQSQATTAVSSVSSEVFDRQVPMSSVDVLKNVPGFYVDSGIGEVRNLVSPRGLPSRGTPDPYFYISLQEDGLPISSVLAGNYAPDYFSRVDITTDRVEAVRGGAASITAANAPGGIVNYLSKRGTEEFEAALRARIGWEANGRDPFYRAELDLSGPLAGGWLFNAGGFYRKSDGPHDAGYALNHGGQLKMNVSRKGDSSDVLLYAKYLDDHNALTGDLPAHDYKDPKLTPGFSIEDSIIPPRVRFSYPTGPDSAKSFDYSRLVGIKSFAIGAKTDWTLGGGWQVSNHLKYSDNKMDWNIGAFDVPQELNNFFSTGMLGQPIFSPAGRGLYTVSDHSTGDSAVFFDNGDGSFNLISNSLPNGAPGSAIALVNGALIIQPEAKEVMDLLTVGKDIGAHALTAGTFFSHSDFVFSQTIQGWGFLTITPQPRPLDITFVPEGTTVAQNVTNPAGYGLPTTAGASYNKGTQESWSVFLADKWMLSDRWSIDAGVRYEDMRYRVRNQDTAGATATAIPNGGLDGDVNTLYDRQFIQFGNMVAVKRDITSLSYSLAAAFEPSDRTSIYLRYARGEKAPSMNTVTQLNDPVQNPYKPFRNQVLQQVELGYNYHDRHIQLSATPFLSLLSDVPNPSIFSDDGGSSVYTLLALNKVRTYGVELEGEVQHESGLGVRTAITLQRSKVTKWDQWVKGPLPGPSDDTIVSYGGNEQAYTPKEMARIAPYFARGPFSAELAWTYRGSIAVNRANAFRLPSFSIFDAYLSYGFTDKLRLGANVTNVFNQTGFYGYGPRGKNFLEALDAEALTPQAVAANPDGAFNVSGIAPPRAYYLTLDYKF